MLTINDDNYLFFIGLDPAIINDYCGVSIHALPHKIPEDTSKWLPIMVELFALQKKNYSSTWNELTQGILSKYQNFKGLNIDYTNEKTLADFLEEKYGDDRVKKTPFTKGEGGTKMQIANSSKGFVDNGYKFPDHTKIANPVIRKNIQTLKQQVINEQVLLNPDGSIKFQHKGKHNDLLHAWMLSLDITHEYMVSKLGYDGKILCGPMRGSKSNHYTIHKKRVSDYKTDASIVRGLTGRPGRHTHYY